MSNQTNQHGLSRYIPSDIKLAVRQACGFGCVVCGTSIIEYEHVEPEFHEAKTHEVSCIALLCSSCHSKVTRNFWSKEKIALARKRPKCKETGFSWGEFDLGQEHPTIRFAGFTFRRCSIPVEIKGTPVIQIQKPEIVDSPFLLSATFTDSSGTPVFTIAQNEWTIRVGVWDTEVAGGRILVRNKEKSQQLILKTEPPNGVSVESMDMQVCVHRLIVDANTLRIGFPNGRFSNMTNCATDGCHVGISIS